MIGDSEERLQKLLGGDALAALRRRLRRYFERLEPGSEPGLLRLGSLLAEEHEALALLTGRPPGFAKSMLVDLAALEASLRQAEIAGSLRDALERLDGPIAHRATVRAEDRARWTAVVASCRHASLAGFLRAPAALGLLKRLARQDAALAAQLVQQAEKVLRRLPAGGLPRAQLAADTLGNSHALDNGQAIATLVLGVWRQLQGEPPELELEEPGDDSGQREERARDVWARAGVAVNELARPALFLNLPVQPGGKPAGMAGEPAYLSLRQLLRAPPAFAVTGLTIFVCENPNLVAIAADSLGPHCRPLACTEGAPGATQRTLLLQLSRAGARLVYHGDFDWPGLRIANHVMSVHGAQPWRFTAADYEAAVQVAPHLERDLAGQPVAACWDPELAPAMQHHGLAIAEESVAASLLADLRLESSAPPGLPDHQA